MYLITILFTYIPYGIGKEQPWVMCLFVYRILFSFFENLLATPSGTTPTSLTWRTEYILSGSFHTYFTSLSISVSSAYALSIDFPGLCFPPCLYYSSPPWFHPMLLPVALHGTLPFIALFFCVVY